MDRKSFIKNTGRWTLLALLAGLVLFLVQKRNLTSGQSCSENQFCSRCSKFGSCNLPQALEQS